MCGIAGILGKQVHTTEIDRCSQSLAHRGPDAAGVYQQGDVCLIHRRLSIIDLSATANQPMYSADKRWVLVFNGEIYNYESIRNRLAAQGTQFTTHSDTEVVLQSLIQNGPSCVESFIGMFAIALYDTQEEKLYLIRDRVGVKPLYYVQQGGMLAFGSELRGLLSWGIIDKDISTAGLSSYLSLGYLPSGQCIIDKVKKVQPGHMLVWDKKTGNLTDTCYWSLESKLQPGGNRQSMEENIAALEDLLISSVKYRMVADVPVGVFLSGGIDSSLVTALLQKHFGNVRTFTIGFDDQTYNEAGYADKVAAYLGTQHYSKTLTAADAQQVLHEYFDMYDEPFADSSGIPTNLVSKFAKSEGCKVVLSADGGDELFGGYGRYITAGHAFQKYNNFPGLAGGAYQAVYNSALKNLRHASWKNIGNKMAKLSDWITAARGGIGDFYPAFLSVPNGTLVHQLTGKHTSVPTRIPAGLEPATAMMMWDFLNYLPDDLLVKVDRATMYNNIEGREPMLDHRLIEFAFNLPLQHKIANGENKVILRELLSKYIPKSYFERPKMGFSIPLFKWFGQELENEFAWAFSPDTLRAITYLDTSEISRQYQVYLKFKQQNRQDNLLFIWHLYCLVKWHYQYMQHS